MIDLEKCSCGKKRENCGTYNFSYSEINFSILRSGLDFCNECLRQEIIGKFDSQLGKLFVVGNIDIPISFEEKESEPSGILKRKTFEIDWQYFVNIEGDNSIKDKKEAFLILDSIVGIFSPNSSGNYEIVSEGIGINPSLSGEFRYFVRQIDVINYAKIKFKNSQYKIEVRKIERTICVN